MDLKTVEFSSDLLSRVQKFECGSAPWEIWVADWIKNAPPFDGALQSMQKYGNIVWLHILEVPMLDEEFVVGFSSLGTQRWHIPPPDGPIRKVGYLPTIAVATRFQGKPEGPAENRYSHVIMEHVLTHARDRKFRELCLCVHKDNPRAQRFYEKFEFKALGGPGRHDLIKMMKLLD